jgi:glycosyltransferase domain-containing protein
MVRDGSEGAFVANLHTLVLPTYNRPNDLKQNLRFLDRQGLKSKCLVLDSSNPDVREQNRASVAEVGLDIEYIEYPTSTHPFDKFADGVSRADTPYVSLCPDDDLLILAGLSASIDALEANSDAVVAHGYYFLFDAFQSNFGIDITTMLYASPSIDGPTPLNRLNSLMTSYQALTYGVYRKHVLLDVYKRMGGPQSLLFRELLTGAVPVLHGKVLRVPEFYMARRHATGDDSQRTRWHPLEWFMRDRDGFSGDYLLYRAHLEEVLAEVSGLSSEQGRRLLDMIHLGYVSEHLTRKVREIVLAEEIAGQSIDEYWDNPALQHALIDAHNSDFTGKDAIPLTSLVASAFPEGAIDEPTGHCAVWPAVLATTVRDYRFYSGFLDNKLSDILKVDGASLLELVNCLDLYDLK